MVQLQCALCGEFFQVKVQINRVRLFCSNKCRMTAIARSFMVPCIRCGTPFKTVPNKILTGQIYCSLACVATPPIERFWRYVEKGEGANPHWFWTGYLSHGGHGQFQAIRGKPTPAHRFSWEIHNGPIPDGLWVLHNCAPLPDLARCVNPAHLYLGTHDDNMRDAALKLQHPRGEGHFRHKFTDAQIIDIRKAFHFLGQSLSHLGRQYSVYASTIQAIINGVTWKHLPITPEQLRQLPSS